MTHRKPYEAPRILATYALDNPHKVCEAYQLLGNPPPWCESPDCRAVATDWRKGILLCERHAGFIDRCFPR